MPSAAYDRDVTGHCGFERIAENGTLLLTHANAQHTHTLTLTLSQMLKLEPSQPEKMIVEHAHSIGCFVFRGFFFLLISQSK